MNFNSKQRANLRAMASTLEPVYIIGKGNVTDNVIKGIDEVLEKRELIKITVLKTADISRGELYRLSQISDLLDRYYSSGKFARCLDFAVRLSKSPFDFYEGLKNFIANNDGREIRKLSQTDAFRVLYGYVRGFMSKKDAEQFEALMHVDFSEHEARRMPLSVVNYERKNDGK